MKKMITIVVLLGLLSSCEVDIVKKHATYAKRYKKRLIKSGKQNTIKAGDSKTPIVKSQGNRIRPLDTENLKEWITTYMDHNYLSFPKYYIINTTYLIAYLDTAIHPVPNYMHFYIAKNSQTADNDLVMVPSVEYVGNEGFNYKHIEESKVFSGFTRSSVCGVKYDPILDAKNYPNENGYPPLNLPAAINPITPRPVCQQRITNYQQLNQFEYSYSLIINSTDLRKFLTDNSAQYPSRTGNVPYLQVYFAYANNDTTKLTIVMVGLDATGNHVYYKVNEDKYAFEAAVPCPYCGVKPDPLIDGLVQQMR